MEINAIRKLAGLEPIKTSVMEGKNFVAAVHTKVGPPAGLFADGSAEKIAKWLKSSHKTLQLAMDSLDFYVNRAGKNLASERKEVMTEVKGKLKSMFMNESLFATKRLAGIPLSEAELGMMKMMVSSIPSATDAPRMAADKARSTGKMDIAEMNKIRKAMMDMMDMCKTKICDMCGPDNMNMLSMGKACIDVMKMMDASKAELAKMNKMCMLEGKEEKVDTDDSKEEKEEELPKIVMMIAKKAVGKEQEELEEMFMKVYEAGMKACQEMKEKEEKSEEK